LKAAVLLGVSLNNLHSLKTWFYHPNGTDKVYFVFDICHMIKLFRNLWKHFRISLQEVKWSYLVKLQTEEGLNAANSLSSRHTHFEQQKMKVKLATQTFSSSVATALKLYLELNQKQFLGSTPTSNFIETMDRYKTLDFK